MAETYVEVPDIQVMRVRADMKGKGPSSAFDLLESKLPTLRGRKFYGIFREKAEGEEYYACVARVDTDDPEKMRLETGVIPGGRFVRRKVQDWEKVIKDGQLPTLFMEMIEAHAHELDSDRFSVEYYRSRTELHLLLPVKGSGPQGPPG
ncbi:MAG TPA: hypothetical protein VLY21_07955 [Nitrososphaerales archaeon]|nr:hypothetical protein [Nitrososphaerales archaeon]